MLLCKVSMSKRQLEVCPGIATGAIRVTHMPDMSLWSSVFFISGMMHTYKITSCSSVPFITKAHFDGLTQPPTILQSESLSYAPDLF